MKMSPRQRKDAIRMALSGKPITHIADKYGVSRTYIYALINPKPKKTKDCH